MCVPRPRKGQTEYFSKLQSNCMKKFCALFFLAAMIFAGCSEKDDAIVESPNRPGETPGQPSETPDETPALTIGTTKYTFPAEGGSVQIPFEVNVDWKTLIEYRTEDSGWLTLTPESGEAGNVVLTITAESNSATEQRTATVHILYSGRLCEVFVIQSAGTPEPPGLTPVLIIENTVYAVAAEGGFLEVPFEVNVDWETLIKYEAGDSGWLTLTPESGEAGNVVLTITAEANSTTEQRTAFVRILYGEKYNTLTIIQSELNVNMNITEAFDPFFAQILQRRGYIANASYITYKEVRNITQIDVSGEAITSLQGIEFFSALTWLDCSSNRLTSLDVSGCTALTELECYGNYLTSLDVSGCTALTVLNCRSNRLTALDVSGCTALTSLLCYINQLISLDVSGCTALTVLGCSENQLTSLDISGCTALTALNCYYNRLTLLDISKNTSLEELYCKSNPGGDYVYGSIFYVMAWFDNNSIPSGFPSRSWTYNGHTIDIEYRKIR